MTIRHWLGNVAQKTEGPGAVRPNEFAEIDSQELIAELRAEELMSKSVADCSDGQCESAHAIVVICTLFRGGHSRLMAQHAAKLLIARLDSVTRQEVLAHASSYHQRIGLNLGDVFGRREKRAS